MKTKWSYRLERVKPATFANAEARAEQINDALNRRGLEGWELVDVIYAPMTSAETHLYFKRPI